MKMTVCEHGNKRSKSIPTNQSVLNRGDRYSRGFLDDVR